MLRLALLLLVLGLASPALALAQEISWAVIKKQIRTTYPDVPHVSTDTLAARLAHATAPLLLDVRSEAEYAVSHLPGARHLPPETEDFEALADLPRETPLVTYCSVGYRSAAMARRLRAAGFTHVENLEGSIFQWANEGRPVVRAGAEVRDVHPYDALWGRLLEPALRARDAGGGS